MRVTSSFPRTFQSDSPNLLLIKDGKGEALITGVENTDTRRPIFDWQELAKQVRVSVWMNIVRDINLLKVQVILLHFSYPSFSPLFSKTAELVLRAHIGFFTLPLLVTFSCHIFHCSQIFSSLQPELFNILYQLGL